ncbi:hypothetical protein H8Q54_004262 [Vibrio parahaemolyticus]|uniref:hypothetical protein n=1 Tax=Vibrio parahaemolyticus TaxID=670 RepID=UPI001A26F734|nr:hypothetical protein [Vibrio parahaemolyticus]EGQ7873375.1 hypothetical protein [Vibrio parahaemolyticus]MCG6463805.1 hypothetical protein [Vibrio parahaemolyticus]MCG6487580.1 hypothetical protein [Vibrio parahaemolyticus]
MNSEEISVLIRKSINILFVSNPRGTSMGVLFGIVMDGLVSIFTPLLKTIAIINLAAIKLWHLIGFGIFAFNVRPFLNRHKIEPSIISAISYIENQKEAGNIDDWQAKQMYRNLHNKVLESVLLNKEQEELSRNINRITSQSEDI